MAPEFSSKQLPESLTVLFSPRLLFRKDGSDIYGLQLDVDFQFSDGPSVLGIGNVFTIHHSGWSDFLSSDPSEAEMRLFTIPAWNEVIAFTRGVLADRVRNSDAKGLLLPPVVEEDFVENVVIDEIIATKGESS